MTLDTDRGLLFDVRENVFWTTINRPHRSNAMKESVLSRIAAGVQAAASNPAIRAIALTGSGDRTFCASRAPGRPGNVVTEMFRVFDTAIVAPCDLSASK